MTLNHLKYYLSGLLISITVSLKAQEILIGVGGGVGTFAMNSTRTFNQTAVKFLPFTPVLISNFPPYFFYKAEAIYCFPKWMAVGINVSTTSTGSRLSLADYSGKFRLDNIQNGLFPGIKLLFGKAPGKSNGFNLSVEGGVAFSKMTVTEELTVFTESNSTVNDFSAMGYFVQPGVCYFRTITSKLKLSANISYYCGFEKGYHLPGNKDQRLLNIETRNPIKPMWDGIRLGITAYWSLRNN
jgi:hypothetical protein